MITTCFFNINLNNEFIATLGLCIYKSLEIPHTSKP